MNSSDLLNQIDGTFQERSKRCTFKHTVLQQGQINQLMDDVVALGLVGDDFVLLVFLFADCILGVV